MKDRIQYFFLFIGLALCVLISPKTAREIVADAMVKSGKWERKNENL